MSILSSAVPFVELLELQFFLNLDHAHPPILKSWFDLSAYMGTWCYSSDGDLVLARAIYRFGANSRSWYVHRPDPVPSWDSGNLSWTVLFFFFLLQKKNLIRVRSAVSEDEFNGTEWDQPCVGFSRIEVPLLELFYSGAKWKGQYLHGPEVWRRYLKPAWIPEIRTTILMILYSFSGFRKMSRTLFNLPAGVQCQPYWDL